MKNVASCNNLASINLAKKKKYMAFLAVAQYFCVHTYSVVRKPKTYLLLMFWHKKLHSIPFFTKADGSLAFVTSIGSMTTVYRKSTESRILPPNFKSLFILCQKYNLLVWKWGFIENTEVKSFWTTSKLSCSVSDSSSKNQSKFCILPLEIKRI